MSEPTPEPENERLPLDRRDFLGSLGILAGTLSLGGGLTSCSNASGQAPGFQSGPRAASARRLRELAAERAFNRGAMTQQSNGDEQLYSNFIGSYSKGLPHNSLGEVDPGQYGIFKKAIESRQFSDLDRLTVGPRKLENPHASISFCLQGADAGSIAMPPAPTFSSAEEAGEIVELYWMALLRDVSFRDYATNSGVANAVTDLNALSDFRGPRVAGQVTPETLFRSPTPGDLNGPYISQLLLRDVPYGTLNLNHRQNTFLPANDYMTNFAEWLAIQQGAQPGSSPAPDATPRYIRNLRDLAAYVQKDVVYQAYLNAAIILLSQGAPFKASADFYAGSTSQSGFINFGGAHIITLLGEVSALALRAMWFQKWFIHRRLRPEAFGGRIHVHMMGGTTYPIHSDALNSAAVSQVQTQNGTALSPMAFPEGSPRHPSYGAGHNVVAAACASVLKSFFDEDFVLPNPVVPSADGLTLEPYTGGESLTVGGEIDKLAGNIAQGRNAAGVHWRSDYTGSMPLGESVTETILREQALVLPESGSFSFRRVDGTIAVIP